MTCKIFIGIVQEPAQFHKKNIGFKKHYNMLYLSDDLVLHDHVNSIVTS
jgi:hypothetical protein